MPLLELDICSGLDIFALNLYHAIYGIHQWISQTMDGENMPINNLLEQTACIVRRCKKTAGKTEQTEGYKRRQIKKLIEFTNDKNLWIDLSRLNLTYMDKGG